MILYIYIIHLSQLVVSCINTWIIIIMEKSLTTRDHHGIQSSRQQDFSASSVKWMETTCEEVPGGAVISS